MLADWSDNEENSGLLEHNARTHLIRNTRTDAHRMHAMTRHERDSKARKRGGQRAHTDGMLADWADNEENTDLALIPIARMHIRAH